MRVLFPEAVALVSAARQGFMREKPTRLGSGASTGGQAHGWSPEWRRGVHGIAVSVKQWHWLPSAHPGGQLHSEQRKRHPTRTLVRQQNHSPDVEQPSGHPPPAGTSCTRSRRSRRSGRRPARVARTAAAADAERDGSEETPVRVRKSPAPSVPAPRNLKNCRLDDFPASLRAAAEVRSIYGARLGIVASTGRAGAGLVARVEARRARDPHFVRQLHEDSAAAGQLHSEQRNMQPEGSVWRSGLNKTAEPLAAGRATLRAAASLDARLAHVLPSVTVSQRPAGRSTGCKARRRSRHSPRQLRVRRRCA